LREQIDMLRELAQQVKDVVESDLAGYPVGSDEWAALKWLGEMIDPDYSAPPSDPTAEPGGLSPLPERATGTSIPDDDEDEPDDLAVLFEAVPVGRLRAGLPPEGIEEAVQLRKAREKSLTNRHRPK
jgi:hypothetical protein